MVWRGAFGCPTTGLVSSTIRDESARGGPGPSQPQRHVLRSIGRPSGRKTHRRVRLSRTHLASGTASGPHRHGGVQTYSFLFHEVLLLALGPSPRPLLFPFIYARPQRVIARLVTRKSTRFRV
ncbi:hypothetical protein DBV15_10498 [Temnothorax longispinosus]|uniref:Uncharacterized protein n=1 Tax=Temnothorax longispinosus TaxID=300112 RepID=A0A4S2KLZ9_9HYME|nr:hypothetical protein DBV15_10498 [Temnothorax longispinosus]